MYSCQETHPPVNKGNSILFPFLFWLHMSFFILLPHSAETIYSIFVAMIFDYLLSLPKKCWFKVLNDKNKNTCGNLLLWSDKIGQNKQFKISHSLKLNWKLWHLSIFLSVTRSFFPLWLYVVHIKKSILQLDYRVFFCSHICGSFGNTQMYAHT